MLSNTRGSDVPLPGPEICGFRSLPIHRSAFSAGMKAEAQLGPGVPESCGKTQKVRAWASTLPQIYIRSIRHIIADVDFGPRRAKARPSENEARRLPVSSLLEFL